MRGGGGGRGSPGTRGWDEQSWAGAVREHLGRQH